jgi:guanylate kinase
MSLQTKVELGRRGLMSILSSPSGAGKTTLSRRLLEKYQSAPAHEAIVMSVSVTTRPMRPGEVDGRDYFFMSPAKFQDMAHKNQLLEYARVFDHQYGTPAAFVRDHIVKGIDVLFDIDWQGTRQLAEENRADLISVFILPPSLEELERRLRERAQDSEETVKKRMEKAKAEISHWREYDYVLINQDLDHTLQKIDVILKAERLKRVRQEGLPSFVAEL